MAAWGRPARQPGSGQWKQRAWRCSRRSGQSAQSLAHAAVARSSRRRSSWRSRSSVPAGREPHNPCGESTGPHLSPSSSSSSSSNSSSSRSGQSRRHISTCSSSRLCSRPHCNRRRNLLRCQDETATRRRGLLSPRPPGPTAVPALAAAAARLHRVAQPRWGQRPRRPRLVASSSGSCAASCPAREQQPWGRCHRTTNPHAIALLFFLSPLFYLSFHLGLPSASLPSCAEGCKLQAEDLRYSRSRR